jgi:predicted metal-binding membrane protein
VSQKSRVLIVSLFVLIVAGMFIFANLRQAELEREQSPTVDTINPSQASEELEIVKS